VCTVTDPGAMSFIPDPTPPDVRRLDRLGAAEARRGTSRRALQR
jgi:hypothetical protein